MSPSSCSLMKLSSTASLSPSSSVNRSRDQSHDAPSRRICPAMRPPYSSFHSHVLFSNASRPMPSRVKPSASSARSTTSCVAMPAWSEPGSHSVGRPRMRATRAITSCRVTNMAWPMCSAPVTLGGGMAMQNGSPTAFGSGTKQPRSSHHWYRRSSVSPCSKFLGRLAWSAPGTMTSLSTRGPAAEARHRTNARRSGEPTPGRTRALTEGVRARREAPGARIARAARAVRVASAAGRSASMSPTLFGESRITRRANRREARRRGGARGRGGPKGARGGGSALRGGASGGAPWRTAPPRMGRATRD